MKRLALFTVLLWFWSGVNACEQHQLPAKAKELVQSYLSAEISHRNAWWGTKKKMEKALDALDRVLADQSTDGDVAVAYLLHLYTGEHSGAELACEAIARGQRMTALVASFSTCRPLSGLEPLPKSLEGSGVLPRRVTEELAAGKTCEREH